MSIIIMLIISLVCVKEFESTLLQNSFPCEFEMLCECRPIAHTMMFSVNCDNKNLSYIPTLPTDIQELVIRQNIITSIEEWTFIKSENLTLLDLSLNMITNVYEKSFFGLDMLKTLILTGNNLNFTQLSLRNVLKPLKNLRYLDMKKNCQYISALDISFLGSLQILKMDFVMDIHSPATFTTTTIHRDLTTLDVSGFTGYCTMHILTTDTFSYFLNLERLDISKCRLNSIANTTLQKLTKLKYLDISDNRCLTFNVLTNISYGLQFSMIDTLNISKLHQTFSLSTELKRCHLEGLKNTKLRVLNIDSNRLQLIEPGAFRLFPRSLEVVSLADNVLSYGQYLNELFLLNIRTVNISFQVMSHPFVNDDEKCDNDKFESESCDYRKEKENNVVEFFAGSTNFFSNSYTNVVFMPYQLRKLIYSHSKLRYVLPNIQLSNNVLEYIDASYNMFYEWQGPISNLKYLKYLDLSNNFCSSVSTKFFNGASNLTTLYVHNNLLGFALPDDKDGNTFEMLIKLEELNLAENHIPSLPQRIFKAQLNLRMLNLSGNMLDCVDFDIEHMKYITFIDLSSNRFSFLSNSFMKSLKLLTEGNRHLKIDISGNPLKCTCETIDFVRDLSNINLYSLVKHQCTSSNGNWNLSNIELVLLHLEKQCSSYSALIVGVTLSILFITVIVISGFVYRFRWKLRYLYYMIKSRNHGYVNMENKKDERDFLYDVFISYADKEGDFVYTKLQSNLELDAGLKCCIHKRDFLPGEEIATNITSAIHKSRKTVVLMSYSFLDSYWCMFEFNMARMESIYSRQKENIIFLVFLEQIMPRDLPLHILELVQSQSYIEYPNDNFGDIVFWENVKRAITI